MSEIKVNSIKGVSASTAALTINNTDGTCTANLSNRQNRNLIINGAMNVAQRGTSSTTGGYQTVDRIEVGFADTDENPTQSQVDVASGTTPYTSGFRKAYRITNGNQTSGAGTSDIIDIKYSIESQDVAKSGWNYTSSSSNITLQFWIKSSVAQNFFGHLVTDDGTSQNYPFETGSLSADTWTKVTKTIPGNSNLQFDNDTGRGLEIRILPFGGTGRTASSATLNQWAAYDGAARTPDNTSTWYTTNDATLEITGLQLEVGSVATDFEHRSFADELLKCQRYCQKLGAGNGTYDCMATGNGVYNTKAYIPYRLMTSMRSTPSFTLLGSASDFYYTRDGGEHAVSNITFDQAGLNMVAVLVTVSTGISNDEGIRLYNINNTGGLLFTAEL
jgi:hypothetical protein